MNNTSDDLSLVSSPSSASDSDAFNTANARVYFGPTRSPEKKFVPVAIHHHHNTLQPDFDISPLRRSPRLFTPRPILPPPGLISEAAEKSKIYECKGNGNGGVRSGTPVNEQATLEEPSSVLATRIIEAQDNPSPPPSVPDINTLFDFDSSLPASPLVSPAAYTTTDFVPPEDISEHTEVFVKDVDLGPSQASLISTTPRTSNDDTISFASFAAPAAVFRCISPHAPTSQILTPNRPSSPLHTLVVKDLFQPIPPVASRFLKGEHCKDRGSSISETTPESGNVQSVVDLPYPTLGGTHKDPLAEPPYNAFVAEQELPHAANRHLVEPHRSGTPYSTVISSKYDRAEGSTTLLESPHIFQKNELVHKTNETSGGDNSRQESSRDKEIQGEDPRGESTRAIQRQLHSLSPPSIDLLSQPLPSQPLLSPSRPPSTTHTQLGILEGVTDEAELTGSAFPKRPLPYPRSPIRTTVLQSPFRVRLEAVALNDPNRTPARRVPIGETRDHVFPTHTPHLGVTPNRVRSQAPPVPILNIQPTESPARRVDFLKNIPPTGPKPTVSQRFASPTRGQPIQSVSGEKLQAGGGFGSQRAMKHSSPLQPPTAGSSIATMSTKLPFPIVTSKVTPMSNVEGVKATKVDSTLRSSSPLKSGLKQTSSRIPRVKPYGRTVPKMGEVGKSAVTTINQRGPRDTQIHPNPDEMKSKGFTPHNIVITPSLKRKRAPEKTSPLDKPRPVVLLPQVPRAGGSSVTSTSKPNDLESTAVHPRVLQKAPDRPTATRPVLSAQNSEDAVDARHEDESKETVEHMISAPEKTLPPKPPPSDPADDLSRIHSNNSNGAVRRRTTRVRKPVNPIVMADLFGNASPRPKAIAQTSDRPFSEMSAVALRALTSSNTVRNQKYLAAKLETEVVRKEGMRPESPGVKVRTVLQRQQDEKSKQRKERANRRAKRGDCTIGDHSETEAQSDIEDFSITDTDSDPEDQNSSPVRTRHKRGPGDEGDYETPVRPERRIKRLKLGDETGEAEPKENERRVKWDRGLYTTIYLDEVKMGVHRPPKENVTTKGCLAPTAKAIPLDNLGNLPHADSPLTEIMEENVIVKKFVYDNDMEPIPEVINVKSTRLRSRKGKN